MKCNQLFQNVTFIWQKQKLGILNDATIKAEKPDFVCEDKNINLPSSSSCVSWMDSEKIFPKLETTVDNFIAEADVCFDSTLTEQIQNVSILNQCC